MGVHSYCATSIFYGHLDTVRRSQHVHPSHDNVPIGRVSGISSKFIPRFPRRWPLLVGGSPSPLSLELVPVCGIKCGVVAASVDYPYLVSKLDHLTLTDTSNNVIGHMMAGMD